MIIVVIGIYSLTSSTRLSSSQRSSSSPSSSVSLCRLCTRRGCHCLHLGRGPTWARVHTTTITIIIFAYFCLGKIGFKAHVYQCHHIYHHIIIINSDALLLSPSSPSQREISEQNEKGTSFLSQNCRSRFAINILIHKSNNPSHKKKNAI